MSKLDRLIEADKVGGAKRGDYGNGRPKPKGVGDGDSITYFETRGTTKPNILRRLAEQRPEIHARVMSGELSANAAAIEAGFRKKPSALDTLTRAGLCRRGVGSLSPGVFLASTLPLWSLWSFSPYHPYRA